MCAHARGVLLVMCSWCTLVSRGVLMLVVCTRVLVLVVCARDVFVLVTCTAYSLCVLVVCTRGVCLLVVYSWRVRVALHTACVSMFDELFIYILHISKIIH